MFTAETNSKKLKKKKKKKRKKENAGKKIASCYSVHSTIMLMMKLERKCAKIGYKGKEIYLLFIGN